MDGDGCRGRGGYRKSMIHPIGAIGENKLQQTECVFRQVRVSVRGEGGGGGSYI